MIDPHEALVYAYKVAKNSTDPSIQNGAVLFDADGCVLSEGWNGFPTGFAESDERWGRPQKYDHVEHAERNSIFYAARLGVPTKGAVMVCPWAACWDCARAIVQAGITTLVRHDPCVKFGNDHGIKWDSLLGPDALMTECGVEIIDYDGRMHAGLSIRHSGHIFKP